MDVAIRESPHRDPPRSIEGDRGRRVAPGHRRKRGIVPCGHVLLRPGFAPPEGHEDLGDQMAVETHEILGPQHDTAVGMPA